MAENNEESNNEKKDINSATATASTLRKHFKRSFMFILIIVVAVILVIVILAAVIKDIIRLGAVKNSNDPNDSNYRAYGPGAYSDSISISTDNIENGVISFGMSVEEMWENDDRYSEYLNSVDELEYLLNAEFVTQYPYIASAGEDEINGTIRFYRNNSEDEMVYVSYDTLESYINSYNGGDTSVLDTALNSFTLNSDGSIMVAYLTEESYSVETNDAGTADSALEQISGSSMSQNGNGVYTVSSSSSILKTKNISYISYVQKYTLPFNLLWSIVVMGHSNEEAAITLAMSIADMAYEGEISLIIDDNNMFSEQVDEYEYYLTDHYNGTVTSSVTGTYTEQEVNTRTGAITSSSSRDLDMSGKDDVTTITDYTVDTLCYATYIETHNENSPTIVIKRIEAWCAIFENDATYESSSNSNADSPNGSTMDDTEEVHIANLSVDEALEVPIPDLVAWKNEYDSRFTDEVINNTDNLNGVSKETAKRYETHYEGTIEQTQNYTDINISSVTSYTNTGYTNGTVTSPVFNEEIVEKFNDSSVSSVRKTICDADDDGWFIPALEVNEDTANLVDLMKYIINVANGDENDTDWETIWSEYSSNFQSFTGIVGDTIQAKVWYALRAAGFSEEATAGAMGNIHYESEDFDPTKVEYGYDEYTGGIGICQWTNDNRGSSGRNTQLREYAASKGVDWTDEDTQVEFLLAELTGTGSASAYASYQLLDRRSYYNNSNAYPAGWVNATSVDDATEAFCYSFERPNASDAAESMSERKYWANYYYEQFHGTTVSSTDERIGTITLSGENATKMLEMLTEACRIADDDRYTYSQSNRYGEYQYDCSSFVARLYQEYFGITTPNTTPLYSTSSEYFIGSVGAVELQPGDVLWKDGHVALYLGNGYVAEAYSGNVATADQIRTIDSGRPSKFTYVYRFVY